jgi:hypothetical protein
LKDFARHTWRTAAASAAMVLVVGAVVAFYPEPAQTTLDIVRLFAIISVGAVTQLTAQFALWAASDFPDGAERLTIAAISRLLSRPGVGAGSHPRSPEQT